MRVYVATTWARLADVVGDALPAGTEGFATTHRLAAAMGAPAPMAASDEVLDELAEVTLAAAADASLLLLAEDAAAGGDGPGTRAGGGPPRRAVLALEVDPGAVSGPDGPPEDVHPAAVLLREGAPAAAVVSVLADDEGDAAVVARAVALLRPTAGGPGDASALDTATDLLADHALGWFDPTEVR